MDFIADRISQRLGGKSFGENTAIYKFARIKKAKAAAREKYPNMKLIDMGVGEPDQAADVGIVQILSREAGKPENRWYADNGIPEFQEAAADYLKRIYHVENIDPLENIIHGIGSKPILAMLPFCLIDPGDIALTTVPGYPVIATHTKYLGGDVCDLPLFKSNDFYPDITSIDKTILEKAKLIYINYPNNPTGQVATKEFYKQIIDFAYKNKIVIVQDASYASIVFDGYEPLSILSMDGAMDVSVEIHSLSKAFNMTGWRLAFIAGNAKLIKAYATVKDNTDSGQFRAIQKAGIYSLNHTELTKANCERYSRRFDLLVKALNEIGFTATKPKGTFYCYVPCPRGTKSGIIFNNAEDASEYILLNSLISTVPWDDAGHYLRFSVTFEANTIEEEVLVIDDMKRRLSALGLLF